MIRYKYLLIGGGMAADAAIHGIRELDSTGSIGLISSEPDQPYNRPPLSKGLWKGQAIDDVWRGTQNHHVAEHLGRTVNSIDPSRHEVLDDQGVAYTFEKLLLATGGRPRKLDFGDDHIIYFRTLADYRRLRQLTETSQRFAVIGGGFIGSELAAALTMNHKEVVMLFPGSAICDRIFPPALAQFLNDYYRKKGVQVLANEKVVGLKERGGNLILRTEHAQDSAQEKSSAQEKEINAIVAGLGLTPNTELAQAAGLRVENGIVVDEFLRTNHPDIYAAGDVASFFNPALQRRLRVEHEDNANTMGLCAGRNMAGAPQPYTHLPFFYSDLFDLGYEAVGELDSRLETTLDWKEPFHEGVIYYHREGQVRGVLTWNLFGKMDVARQLIAEHRPFRLEEFHERLLEAA